MPWRERSPVDLRVEFIRRYRSGLWSMTELTEHYGISRKTGYEWVARSETGGIAAMLDQSRRPQTQPTATERALVAARGDPSAASALGREEAPGHGPSPGSGGGLAESIDGV